MPLKNTIKFLFILGFISTEYIDASIAMSAFKIKDISKYYIFYLPNRVPVLKGLYNNYQAKNISCKKFTWSTTLEALNACTYIEMHKMAAEYLYEYFKDHSQPEVQPIAISSKNNGFLTNQNIGIAAGTVATVGLVYYIWKKYYGHKDVGGIPVDEIHI